MLNVRSIRRDAGMDWLEEGAASGLFQLVLMTYGKCLYRIAGHKVILEKGDMLLIPGTLNYYGQSIPTAFHEKYTVTFAAELPQLPLLSRRAAPVKWKTGMHELMTDRFKQMAAQWDDTPPYFETMCEAYLLELLVHANRELDKGPPADFKHRMAEQMISYIKAHYREKLTKERLADHIGKSPGYTAALFREMTGYTIGEYAHRQRIRTAEYLLAESQLTISDIADYLGYCDVSFFHRTFKRLTGRTPGGKETQ